LVFAGWVVQERRSIGHCLYLWVSLPARRTGFVALSRDHIPYAVPEDIGEGSPRQERRPFERHSSDNER
jgi:hypothetical protein